MMTDGRPLWLLGVVVLVACVFAAYSAYKLDRATATCEQLNEVIARQNFKGEILRRLLTNAADAREASALLEESSPAQRRIDQRAAVLYRRDAERIFPLETLKC